MFYDRTFEAEEYGWFSSTCQLHQVCTAHTVSYNGEDGFPVYLSCTKYVQLIPWGTMELCEAGFPVHLMISAPGMYSWYRELQFRDVRLVFSTFQMHQRPCILFHLFPPVICASNPDKKLKKQAYAYYLSCPIIYLAQTNNRQITCPFFSYLSEPAIYVISLQRYLGHKLDWRNGLRYVQQYP